MITPVVMRFQMQICSILRFWQSVVFICERAKATDSNASSREEYIPQVLTMLNLL